VAKKFNTVQDRGGNFRGKDGKLYLERCYVCNPEYGKENYGPAVASGICAWCGWSEKGKEKVNKKEAVKKEEVKDEKMKKLIKIVMEFDNGVVQYLEGEDAKSWHDAVNGAISNAWIHGSRLPKFPWKYEKDKSNKKLVSAESLDDSGYRVLTHGLPIDDEERNAIIKVVEKVKKMDAEYLNKIAKKTRKKK